MSFTLKHKLNGFFVARMTLIEVLISDDLLERYERFEYHWVVNSEEDEVVQY